MCHNVKTIAKNKQGQLSYCTDCKVYRLIFNNLQLDFSPQQLNRFKKYIDQLETEYWELKYERVVKERKIPVPSAQDNLVMIFNKHELQLLRSLLHLDTPQSMEIIDIVDINYTLFLN